MVGAIAAKRIAAGVEIEFAQAVDSDLLSAVCGMFNQHACADIMGTSQGRMSYEASQSNSTHASSTLGSQRMTNCNQSTHLILRRDVQSYIRKRVCSSLAAASTVNDSERTNLYGNTLIQRCHTRIQRLDAASPMSTVLVEANKCA